MYVYIYYKSDITSKSNKQNLQSWLELYYDQILFTKSYLSIKFFLSFLLPIFLMYLYLWFSFKSCSITTIRISLRIIQIKKKNILNSTLHLILLMYCYIPIRVWIVINFSVWTMNVWRSDIWLCLYFVKQHLINVGTPCLSISILGVIQMILIILLSNLKTNISIMNLIYW